MFTRMIACGVVLLLIAAACGCATTGSNPPAPELLVGVWNLTREGATDATVVSATRPLTLAIASDGSAVYSDAPAEPLQLRMIQDLSEPVAGVRTGRGAFITDIGAISQISFELSDDDATLKITDNTHINSATRVQYFEKVVGQ